MRVFGSVGKARCYVLSVVDVKGAGKGSRQSQHPLWSRAPPFRRTSSIHVIVWFRSVYRLRIVSGDSFSGTLM